MAIKKIRVKNFKSFKDVEIELGNFNVLIGPNASGKSNFIQIFKFLKDIVQEGGLINAISMQGGIEFLRNINIKDNDNLLINIVSVPDEKYTFLVKVIPKKVYVLEVSEIIYQLELKFSKNGLSIEKSSDQIIQSGDLIEFEEDKEDKNNYRKKKSLGKGKAIHSSTSGKMNTNLETEFKDLQFEKNDIIPPYLKTERLSKKLILESHFFQTIQNIFREMSFYDFDPKLPKKATPMKGKAMLEEDGNNLSIVLKNIVENEKNKRKFFNLMKDILPFIDDLNVARFEDKSLIFKVKENYFNEQYLPATLLSDGTINIAALILAIYFEQQQPTIIEEPERNIHPHLISKVVNMMQEASSKKQIIVTTHNSEIVKNAGLENLLFISRDKQGFSKISRPSDKTDIQNFLSNDIGIEELYIQNLLEA